MIDMLVFIGIVVVNVLLIAIVAMGAYFFLFVQPRKLGGGVFTFVPQMAGQFVMRGRRMHKFVPGAGTTFDPTTGIWSKTSKTPNPGWFDLTYVGVGFIVDLTKVLVLKMKLVSAELVDNGGQPRSEDRLKEIETDHLRFINIFKWKIEGLECKDGSTIESATFQLMFEVKKPIHLIFGVGQNWPDKACEFVQACLLALMKKRDNAVDAIAYIGDSQFETDIVTATAGLEAAIGLKLIQTKVTELTLSGPLSAAVNAVVENKQKAAAAIEKAKGDAEVIKTTGKAEAKMIAAKGAAAAAAATAMANAYNQPGGKEAAMVDAMTGLGKTTGTVILGKGIMPTLPIGGKPPTSP